MFQSHVRLRACRFRQLLSLTAACLLANVARAGTTLHVDDDAPPGGDGLSWVTAYRFLQDSLADAAASGGAVTEIRVAQGVYTPDRDEGDPDGSGDQDATFQLLDDVALVGGYAGIDAPDPDARDTAAYEAILSGDLAGDDGHYFEDDGHSIPNRWENSQHVVTGSGTGQTAVLDGFTIACGFRDQTYEPRGAGMLNVYGSPTVRSCVFAENALYIDDDAYGGGGGAMYNEGSNVRIIDCAFKGNIAAFYFDGCDGGSWVGGPGGAIYNLDSSPTISGCTFYRNSTYVGGAIYNEDSTASVIDCLFLRNHGMNHCAGSSSPSGAIVNSGSDLTIASCLFVGNRGGAIQNAGGSLLVVNCTFSDNWKYHCSCRPPWAGCWDDAGRAIDNESGSVVVLNSTLWGLNPTRRRLTARPWCSSAPCKAAGPAPARTTSRAIPCLSAARPGRGHNIRCTTSRPIRRYSWTTTRTSFRGGSLASSSIRPPSWRTRRRPSRSPGIGCGGHTRV
ncbi:MAG: right-handed parallel beta-helix repeat-containing protein [Planctomycetota bacterium]